MTRYDDAINEGYSPVCGFNDLKHNEGKRIFLDDVEIALFKVENEIYAVSNICPHQQSAVIYDGFLEEGYVVCPAHGWMFNLKDGKTKSGGRGLKCYDVKVIDNTVFVKAEKKEWNW
jgi:NAD(P)H-dependent nitrite reductase small subunit